MKTLIMIFLGCLVATSALAVTDPEPDMIGIYFDLNADNNCTVLGPSIPFIAYLITTSPSPAAINAYEFGFTNHITPAGNDGMLFMLASNIANGAVSGLDVGEHTPTGGDYIVGLASPLATSEATILHSWQYMLLTPVSIDMFLFQSSKPSIPGTFPVLQNAEGSILYQVGQSSGSWEYAVACVNLGDQCCPLATEERSFGSVKGLYR
jgi:hypothetical protein